jgi:hypothetical protein
VNRGGENHLTKLSKPGSRTHRIKDRALDSGVYGFSQLPLIVSIVVDPRVVSVIYRLIETMLDERPNTVFSELIPKCG